MKKKKRDSSSEIDFVWAGGPLNFVSVDDC